MGRVDEERLAAVAAAGERDEGEGEGEQAHGRRGGVRAYRRRRAAFPGRAILRPPAPDLMPDAPTPEEPTPGGASDPVRPAQQPDLPGAPALAADFSQPAPSVPHLPEAGPEAAEPETKEPAPRGPAGLIGPTLAGMAVGIVVILAIIWLT